MLQSYKDETMSIELVKSEIASLFEGHPTLLDQFSFFLPTPAPENKLKKKERYVCVCIYIYIYIYIHII